MIRDSVVQKEIIVEVSQWAIVLRIEVTMIHFQALMSQHLIMIRHCTVMMIVTLSVHLTWNPYQVLIVTENCICTYQVHSPSSKLTTNCNRLILGRIIMCMFIEQKVFVKLTSFAMALFIWFCTHYVFNLEYHKYCANAAMFFQEFIFELPEGNTKKRSNVT